MATITYKCPNCGGGMIFDPASQKFKCEFCLSDYTQAQLDELQKAGASDQVYEEAVGAEDAQAAEPAEGYYEEPSGEGTSQEGSQETAQAETQSAAGAGSQAGSQTAAGGKKTVVVYTCPSCGAEVVTDETTAATFCYYCHNPVVLEGRVSGEFLPDKIIPFQFDKKEATERFLKYVRGKKFVPKAFFNEEQIEKLSGVYYPFWIYDCEVEGGIDGHARNVRVWRSGMFEYTETSTYSFERGGNVHVQNITRNALKESDRNLIDAVRPFEIDKATQFSLPYLQGFVAQKRDVETNEVSQELQTAARGYAEKAMAGTVKGYTSVTTDHRTLHPVREKWQYLLLPVWVLTYGSNSGQRYYYAMNGQTGEIKGKLPIDFRKLSGVSAIIGGILAGACLLASYFVL